MGRFDVDSKVEAGEVIEMVATTEKLHFFDLDTELAIGGDG